MLGAGDGGAGGCCAAEPVCRLSWISVNQTVVIDTAGAVDRRSATSASSTVEPIRMKAAQLSLLGIVALCGAACNPSDLKAWIEGNQDIPADWEAFVPAQARENLIDAELENGELKLRYHEGEWTELVNAFEAPVTKAGYTKLATCPSDSGEVGSVLYAKPTAKGAEVLAVGLSVLIKSSGHFFLRAQKGENSSMSLPKGCVFTEDAANLCKSTADDYCSFKTE